MMASKPDDLVRLEKIAAEYVKEREGPKVVTLAQFQPYVDLFRIDHDKLNKDLEYRRYIVNLFREYRRDIGHDPYRPMFVIVSETDRRIVGWFNKVFNQIHSDHVEGHSARNNVPSVMSPSAPISQDELIANGSLVDLARANQTPEMIQYFQQQHAQGVIVEAMFYLLNASPKKKAEFMAQLKTQSLDTPSQNDGDSPFAGGIVDD